MNTNITSEQLQKNNHYILSKTGEYVGQYKDSFIDGDGIKNLKFIKDGKENIVYDILQDKVFDDEVMLFTKVIVVTPRYMHIGQCYKDISGDYLGKLVNFDYDNNNYGGRDAENVTLFFRKNSLVSTIYSPLYPPERADNPNPTEFIFTYCQETADIIANIRTVLKLKPNKDNELINYVNNLETLVKYSWTLPYLGDDLIENINKILNSEMLFEVDKKRLLLQFLKDRIDRVHWTKTNENTIGGRRTKRRTKKVTRRRKRTNRQRRRRLVSKKRKTRN
jgi:hypothetical protein